ncbi:MAG: pyrroline-5-carboxylate reductase [Rhodoferax sp.]|nr:pyrroline-5-carboxylate reductase [Rhodoferax sp.]
MCGRSRTRNNASGYKTEWGVQTLAQADASLAQASAVVWAVKPQMFESAATALGAQLQHALHISVMAGIPCRAIEQLTGSRQVVRTMPNTPALVGKGITGVFAGEEVTSAQRQQVSDLIAPTGQQLWVDKESDLDAVTALSGSGPAYVFYFIEAMVQAALDMGLSAEQGRSLALSTFAGATALGQASTDPVQILRERVTSKGGTTHAAISHMQEAGVASLFVQAMRAAQRRAAELGQEFGGSSAI